jgi:hypothetical protein
MSEKALQTIITEAVLAGPGTRRLVKSLAAATLELAEEVTQLRAELDELKKHVGVESPAAVGAPSPIRGAIG